jgi:hypothetical protein
VKVSELIEALKGVSPDARVTLWGKRGPSSKCPPGEAEGDVIYIAVSNVDDVDTLVVLSNVLVDKRGNDVFEAPPQFKRFKIRTTGNFHAAVADLTEQAHSEPTKDLATHLEVERMKSAFRSFEDLLNQVQTNKENPDV